MYPVRNVQSVTCRVHGGMKGSGVTQGRRRSKNYNKKKKHPTHTHQHLEKLDVLQLSNRLRTSVMPSTYGTQRGIQTCCGFFSPTGWRQGCKFLWPSARHRLLEVAMVPSPKPANNAQKNSTPICFFLSFPFNLRLQALG